MGEGGRREGEGGEGKRGRVKKGEGGWALAEAHNGIMAENIHLATEGATSGAQLILKHIEGKDICDGVRRLG